MIEYISHGKSGSVNFGVQNICLFLRDGHWQHYDSRSSHSKHYVDLFFLLSVVCHEIGQWKIREHSSWTKLSVSDNVVLVLRCAGFLFVGTLVLLIMLASLVDDTLCRVVPYVEATCKRNAFKLYCQAGSTVDNVGISRR